MSVDTLMTWPCTLVRRSAPTTPDVYNDAQPLAEATQASTCYWEVKRTSELEGKGQTEVDHVIVFLGAGTADLEAIDAVRIQGGPTVEAFGAPHQVMNARTGLVHHVELVGKVTV
jgi:hypothetical protein